MNTIQSNNIHVCCDDVVMPLGSHNNVTIIINVNFVTNIHVCRMHNEVTLKR